jgi:hypothetical protein
MGHPLCAYSTALGIPGQGVHSYRIADIAVVDVILTLIAAYIITLITGIPFTYSAIGIFVLGIIAHRLFCVRTTVDKLLFPLASE